MLPILLTFFVTATKADNVTYGYNVTYDSHKVACVYSVSGQYGILARVLYYCLLVFGVVAQKHVWLIAGALASAMTYSGAAAIHAIVLAGISMNSQLDLDIFGVWSILSSGLLVALPVSELSETLRESQFSFIFGAWASLLSLGCILCMVALFRQYPIENACRSASGTLLSSTSNRWNPEFNCTYDCFAVHQMLRANTDIAMIPASRVMGRPASFMIVTAVLTAFFGCFWGVFTWCGLSRKSTEAELRQRIEFNKDVRHSHETSRMRRLKKEARRRAEAELAAGKYIIGRRTRLLLNTYVLYFLVVVVLNESFLLIQGGLPTGEESSSVGQWAPWVGVALALVAAAINRRTEPQWASRQKELKKDRENFESRKQSARSQQKQIPPTAVAVITVPDATLVHGIHDAAVLHEINNAATVHETHDAASVQELHDPEEV